MITITILAVIAGWGGALMDSNRVLFGSAAVAVICLCARFLP